MVNMAVTGKQGQLRTGATCTTDQLYYPGKFACIGHYIRHAWLLAKARTLFIVSRTSPLTESPNPQCRGHSYFFQLGDKYVTSPI
jgi:hypothetical protein